MSITYAHINNGFLPGINRTVSMTVPTSASLDYSRTRAPRPMRPLTLSLSPSGGEGIEPTPSPSARERVGVKVAPVFTHSPG